MCALRTSISSVKRKQSQIRQGIFSVCSFPHLLWPSCWCQCIRKSTRTTNLTSVVLMYLLHPVLDAMFALSAHQALTCNLELKWRRIRKYRVQPLPGLGSSLGKITATCVRLPQGSLHGRAMTRDSNSTLYTDGQVTLCPHQLSGRSHGRRKSQSSKTVHNSSTINPTQSPYDFNGL